MALKNARVKCMLIWNDCLTNETKVFFTKCIGRMVEVLYSVGLAHPFL